MFNDSVSFNGGTRVEVIAVLANCGRDTDRARRALVTWIRHKQDKGRSTEHILLKLQAIESKFIKDSSLHNAFRDARAETFLPRPPDLPLPYSIRRRSEIAIRQSEPPITTFTHNIVRPSSIYPPPASPPADLTQRTSPISPLRRSRGSSQITSPGNPNTDRWTCYIPHPPQPSTPRINIPRDRSPPAHDSPITSSPEDSGPHFGYRHMSDPLGPSFHSQDTPSPPSASPPDFPVSAPSPRTQIPPGRPLRNVPHPIPTSPSSRRKSTSSSLRGVTPPRTSPPDFPLPPIPSCDQDIDSHKGLSKQLLAEQPPTPTPPPMRSPSLRTPTPMRRPLPMQPIPSPVPSSCRSEYIDTLIGAETHRRESSEEYILEEIIRQDSPVFVIHEDDDQAGRTIGAPPPYVDHHITPSSIIPKFDETLTRAMNVCGGSLQVRREVAKCIEFHRGYEPPYWQSRLQACGLNAEAANYLVDAMCRQVDWSTSCGRVDRT